MLSLARKDLQLHFHITFIFGIFNDKIVAGNHNLLSWCDLELFSTISSRCQCSLYSFSVVVGRQRRFKSALKIRQILFKQHEQICSCTDRSHDARQPGRLYRRVRGVSQLHRDTRLPRNLSRSTRDSQGRVRRSKVRRCKVRWFKVSFSKVQSWKVQFSRVQCSKGRYSKVRCSKVESTQTALRRK